MTPTPSSAWSIDEAVREAIARLGLDGIVAYPTETVWGLGACAAQPRAVERLLAWKGRASDSPLAVLVSGKQAADSMGCDLRAPILRLMDAFWPGPLTIVAACRKAWAPGVARVDGALGLRCSPHPLASAVAAGLFEAGLGPLTSTSLNRSGEAPARVVEEAIGLTANISSQLLDTPLLISVAGHEAGGARPSTVVDCTASEITILRQGAIARDAIGEVWSG